MQKILFTDKITHAVFLELAQVALNRKTCSYQYIGERVGIPHQHDALGKYLGEISEYFYGKYKIMVSVIVVNQTGKPGDGFATLAWNLNHPNIRRPNFIAYEMNQTYALFENMKDNGQI